MTKYSLVQILFCFKSCIRRPLFFKSIFFFLVKINVKIQYFPNLARSYIMLEIHNSEIDRNDGIEYKIDFSTLLSAKIASQCSTVSFTVALAQCCAKNAWLVSYSHFSFAPLKACTLNHLGKQNDLFTLQTKHEEIELILSVY